MSRYISLSFLAVAVLVLLSAASPMVQDSRPDKKVADGSSIDSMLRAIYEVISGPAGQERDWDRFRNLFHKDARMTAVVAGPEGKGFALRSFTPQDYVKRSGKLLERGGFFEVEIARKTEKFGHIAHCFSSYELKQGGKNGKSIARGINSMQLLNDGKRWWFLSIYWESEKTAGALPKRYLSGN